ncbi:hypothetical protein EIP91_000722 [Steccherinum ochraceum]|uniref:4-hydroxybenzoate polyprenyltransferase, mitochondrial n=1 Tax=Steccherinum ochraceum TaxID=92696 RepID=A0A4R0RVW2_9APHY|nr:hypothetical protein EIP91_000722 [Steccherinum ochraceum]
MAPADVNKQLWQEKFLSYHVQHYADAFRPRCDELPPRDDALTRLLDLSTLTVNRNSELETRVSELELELAVWKQAHSTIRDAAEREKKSHNVQVATFNRQISTLSFIKSQNPLIHCAVDGNVNLFHSSFLTQGQQGGRKAAQSLTGLIAEYLSQEDIQVFGRLSFWITLFINRQGLLAELLGGNSCTTEQFNAFLLGFSLASPRFLVVDVGPASDGVELKIREYLSTYVRFPQTLRVFLCGGRDGDYLSILNELGKEELLGKLVLLLGHTEPSKDFLQFALPSIPAEDIFMPRKQQVICPRPVPGPITLPTPNMSHLTTTGGLISPESETHSSLTSSQSQDSVGRLIDPTKPLHKQNPPPCNEHYLMSCSKGAGCKYSHDWLLTPEQLDTLAKNAKKAPCNYLKNGLDCPYGDNCCWWHALLPPEQREVLSAVSTNPQLLHLLSVFSIVMSAPHEDDEFAPSSTPGYKIGAAKTVEEYANLDAEDESLARWKASLGIVPGATGAAASGPQVTVETLELASATLPAGRTLKMNIHDPAQLAQVKKNPFVIKEGVEYNVRITFKVNHGICSGVRYMQVVKRSGVRVDKMEQMLGSYGPHPKGEAYVKNFDPEESPSGMLARSGTYHVRSRVLDDDGHVYAARTLATTTSPDAPVVPPPPASWIDRFPTKAQPYLRLIRADKPIGSGLLFIPCAWSITMASYHLDVPFMASVKYLGLFGVGAVIMRGAGCIINDMWDRKLDKAVGLVVLTQLNWYSIYLGASSLSLVTIYPFMKRITYWPQAVLGLAFNWGALLGWSAIAGAVDWSICLPLYAGSFLWTIVYDTIYAHQDKFDDVTVGIRSTALLFGAQTRLILSTFTASSLSLITFAGYHNAHTLPFYAGVGVAAVKLARILRRTDFNSRVSCWKGFVGCGWAGFWIWVGALADYGLLASGVHVPALF